MVISHFIYYFDSVILKYNRLRLINQNKNDN